MIAELCIEATALGELKRLLDSKVEQCATLLASRAERADGRVRLLVRDVVFPDGDSYQVQTNTKAQLSPGFVAYFLRPIWNPGQHCACLCQAGR